MVELAPVTGPVLFIAPQLAPALEAWRTAVPIPTGHVSKHLLLAVLLV
jgi:hypothetical protein